MKLKKKVAYVLKKPLRKKGSVGDVINVTQGFGRYLERELIAQRASADVLQNLEISKQQWQAHEAENEKNAALLIEKIKDIKLVMKRRVSQGDRLYESVRPEHIVLAFKERAIDLHNNNIKLNHQIKKLGQHNFIVHAYGNYEVELSLEVVTDSEE